MASGSSTTAVHQTSNLFDGVEHFPLYITSKYALQWKAWEGVREFVQNWHDGVLSTLEVEGGHQDMAVSFEKQCSKEEGMPDVVEYRAVCPADRLNMQHGTTREGGVCVLGKLFYDKDNKSITMVNVKTCLGRNVFLLGHSKKPNREEVIGKFGEGLKLGSLALVRLGYRVTMCTGEERWRFGLEVPKKFRGKTFSDKVLTVFIKKRSREEMDHDDFEEVLPPCPVELAADETLTQIWPVQEQEWKDYSRRFLFLEKPQKVVSTKLGSLVLDEELAGKLYVKKVWIGDLKEENIVAAIDLNNIELDRDRQACVDMSQLEHSLSSVWVQAVNKDHSLVDRYCRLLYEGKSREVADAKTYIKNYADLDTCKALADAFFRWKGEGFPVSTATPQNQIRQIKQELSGKKMHLINEALYSVLKRAGRIPQLEKKPKPVEEPYVPPPITPRKPHQPSANQKKVIDKAESIVLKFQPNFPFRNVVYYNEEYGEVWKQDDVIEVPTWILSSSKVHSRLSNFRCPSSSKDQCSCASVYLASSFLWLNHSHYQDMNDLLFRTISFLAHQVHTLSEEDALSSAIVEEKHYHQVVLEKREEELQKLVEGLEEEREKRINEFDESMAGLQRQLDQVQKRVENSKLELEERKRATREHSEKEISDMDEKFQGLRKDNRLKIEDAARKNTDLQAGIESTEREYKDLQEQHRQEQMQYDEEQKDKSEKITMQTRRIASVIAAQHKMVKDRASLILDERSEIVQRLDAFQKEFDEMRTSGKCEICTCQRYHAVLLPCQHLYMCLQCSEKLQECPECHQSISDRKKLFMS